jgi:2-amino-4-hydroxy-6-hydroxymethyldihydropteridine diphosphokinase
MSRVWLSLGSNIDRERHIRGAVQALRETFGELIVSRVYESESVGFKGGAFFNLVVGFDTERPPQELCRFFRTIEAAHGRERCGEKFASRTLDIDLLIYGDQTIKQGKVEIPREEITQYAFVLLPLAEVAGDERHPVLGMSYRELWQGFDGAGQVLEPVEFDLFPTNAG